MRFLRRRCPVVRLPRLGWLVTRRADVCELLARDQDFTVPYGPKMEALIGPFILGMNDPPYDRERSALEAVVVEGDLTTIARGSRAHAERLLAAADGRIDAIGELIDPVVERSITEYFGIPAPDTSTLLAGARPVFHEVFLNEPPEEEVSRRAKRAADEVGGYLRSSIVDRWRTIEEGDQPRKDVVLDRLIARVRGRDEPFLERERIGYSLFGLLVAWAVSVSRATGRALDELLRRERELGAAQAAARAENHASVEQYLLEALRFNPQATALDRICVRGATLAKGTREERVLPPNAKVLAHIGSAMMDERAPELVEPSKFRVDRPPSAYLHFGHGLHRCFGEQISRTQMTAIAMALLPHDDLRRAGKLELEGPFPARLAVAFER